MTTTPNVELLTSLNWRGLRLFAVEGAEKSLDECEAWLRKNDMPDEFFTRARELLTQTKTAVENCTAKSGPPNETEEKLRELRMNMQSSVKEILAVLKRKKFARRNTKPLTIAREFGVFTGCMGAVAEATGVCCVLSHYTPHHAAVSVNLATRAEASLAWLAVPREKRKEAFQAKGDELVARNNTRIEQLALAYSDARGSA